jgi:hypothetical protein
MLSPLTDLSNRPHKARMFPSGAWLLQAADASRQHCVSVRHGYTNGHWYDWRRLGRLHIRVTYAATRICSDTGRDSDTPGLGYTVTRICRDSDTPRLGYAATRTTRERRLQLDVAA